jgi:translation initiation factor 5A
MAKTTGVIKDLKPNGFVLIDDAPCRIERVDVSKSGKHGAAKARVEAIGLFDNRRRSLVKPADDTVEVPILEKKRAQIISIMGGKAQLMDLSDFSVFELEIPEERREKIKQGEEVDYFEIVGIRTLKELK